MNTKKVEQQKSKSQAIELKAFEIIQKNLTYAGIYSDATNQSNSFNWTVFIGFLSLGSGILFTSAFIIFDAKTIVEYTQSIYAVSVLTLILLCFLIIVVNAKNLFKFIDSSGYLVNTSESRTFCVNEGFGTNLMKFSSTQLFCIEISFH